MHMLQQLRKTVGGSLRTLVTVVAVLVVVIPAAAWASHQFNDVPNSNIFHGDIDWMSDNGVTKGCNPPANNKYCPDDFVTREQMSAFMHRLETEGVFLPADGKAKDADNVDGLDSTAFARSSSTCGAGTYVSGIGSDGQVDCTDLPTVEVVSKAEANPGGSDDGTRSCITSAYTPTRDGRAVATASYAAGFDNSTGLYFVRVQVSTDNGATWTNATEDNSPVAGDESTASTGYHSVTYVTDFPLSEGTSYLFAIRYLEESSAPVAPLTGHQCQLQIVDHPGA